MIENKESNYSECLFENCSKFESRMPPTLQETEHKFQMRLKLAYERFQIVSHTYFL